MRTSHRPVTLRLLAAAALGALVLTGCGEQTKDSAAPAGSAKTAAPAPTTAAPAPTAAGDESTAATPSGKSPFAGTKQFVTIEKAWTEDGLTKLSVRTAEKKVNTQFDTWEITPGTGDFSTVTLAKDARVLLTVPVREADVPAGSGRAVPVETAQADFVTQFTKLDPRESAGVGFDLSFDGQGQVTKVASLFRP